MSATSKLETPHRANLAGRAQAFERVDGFRERYASPPMQQVQVDAFDAHAAQAAFARGGHAGSARVLRIYLGHYKNRRAATGDRACDDFLGTAVAVHLRGVDQCHAHVEPALQRSDLASGMRLPLAHRPGTEAQRRHRRAIGQRDRRNVFCCQRLSRGNSRQGADMDSPVECVLVHFTFATQLTPCRSTLPRSQAVMSCAVHARTIARTPVLY